MTDATQGTKYPYYTVEGNRRAEGEAMNTEEIIKLAREAGGYDGFTSPPTDWGEGDFVISPEQLSKFATLVRNEALEALKAEVESLRTDAERYRWLRDKGDSITVCEWSDGEWIPLHPKNIDAAIDAAMGVDHCKLSTETEALRAEVERLRADRDSWEQQASDRVADWHAEHLRAERLAEALEDIRSRSCMNLAMNPNLYELTALLGDIHQIADAALGKENRNDQ